MTTSAGRDWQIDPSQPIAAQLSSLIVQQVSDSLVAFDTVPPDKAIHETRKALKRLRALLRLTREFLGDDLYRQMNYDYRDIARLLAGRREQSALLESVEKLGDATESAADDDVLAPLQHRLATAQTAHPVADAELRDVARNELRRIAAQANELDLAVANDETKLSNGLRRCYRQGRRRMEAARRDPTAHKLHEWRKSVKHLWTQHQLLEPLNPDWYQAQAELWHRLSDHLGDDHDLYELRLLLAADPTIAGGEAAQAAIFMLIDNERHRLQQEAWQLGELLFAEKPSTVAQRLIDQWQRANDVA